MENIEIMEEVIGELKDASEAVDNAVETVKDKVKDEATKEVTTTTEEVEEAAEETPEEVAEETPEEVTEKTPEKVIEEVAEEIVDKVEKSKDGFTVILKEVASLKNMVKDVIRQINENDTKIKEVRAEIAELFFDGTTPTPEETEIDFTNLF